MVDGAWKTPGALEIAAARAIFAPWHHLTAPVFLHTDRVPQDRPVLFIANHTLMGVLDTPLLMLGIHERTGHYPRSMADDFHYAVPLWRDMLSHFGAVPGSRDACRALMRDGASLLVFPGGGREVFKRRGEQYKLIWGKRSGFARMAFEAGYTIVPVAAVGADDCYRILLDQNDLERYAPLRKLLSFAPRKDVGFPTIVAGLGGTLVPIPERFYFSFGEPIESAHFQGRGDDETMIFELREAVRMALEAEIADLLRYRDADPRRSFKSRWVPFEANR